MITFIGEYTAKIDDKGRVVFPAPFKSMFSNQEDLRMIIKKNIFDSCLEMFSYEEWEYESDKIKCSLDFFNKEHVLFWREYMRNCAIVEPEPKLGRITIPKKLLDLIGADKTLVFSGNHYKIEIWAQEKYDQSQISNEEYINIATKLSNQK